MFYFVVFLNLLLGIAITSPFYPFVGVVFAVFSSIMVEFVSNTSVGMYFIRKQTQNWGNNVADIVFKEKKLLMSVVCLTLALKIGAAIALFVEIGAAVFIAFSLLLIFGYFFNGPLSILSGMINSWYIARFILKIFSLLSIGFDKIAEWIAKGELALLNIKYDN